MKRAIAALLLIAFTQPLHAESCKEKFARLLSDVSSKGPVRIHLTQSIKGGMTSTNYNYQTGDGDWMTEMIDPKNMQWSLVRNNVLYSSSDQGKTWKKIRVMDDAMSNDDVKKVQEEAASTATNEKCGSEELDGVMHETVEADYSNLKYKTEHHQKYWVDPKSGWITKTTMETKQGAFESSVIQIIEKAPDLSLPSPKQ